MRTLFIAVCFCLGCICVNAQDSGPVATDAGGNVLRRVEKKDASGRNVVAWELQVSGGTSEVVQEWTEQRDPPGIDFDKTHISSSSLQMGFPGVNAIHFEKGVLDVFGRMTGTGAYDVMQFQKVGNRWAWTKWTPFSDVGYTANSGPGFTIKWLGLGKWEVTRNPLPPNTFCRSKPSHTIELLGFFDYTHHDVQVMRLDGEDLSKQGERAK